DALVVGDEVDAVADPARRGDVAVEVEQPLEVAGPRAVNVEIASGAAAIALPERWLGGIAAQDDSAARPEGNGARWPIGECGCWAARWRDLLQRDHAPRWLARRTGVDDGRAIGSPRRDRRRIALIGEPPRLAAVGGHDVDFARPLGPASERDLAPIRRETRVARLGHVGGQTLGASSGCAHAPEVVFGDEYNRVARNRGETEIPLHCHALIPSLLSLEWLMRFCARTGSPSTSSARVRFAGACLTVCV